MQGQGMQKFSSILFWNMAVVIFTSDTRINRSWHCLPSCSYSHAGWHNVKLIAGLNSRHLRTSHEDRTRWFFLFFWNILARGNNGSITVANIAVSRTVQFLWFVSINSISRAAKVLGCILAAMVLNWQNRTMHQKLLILGQGHWCVGTTASSNTRENRTNHDCRQAADRPWWLRHKSIFAISETIGRTNNQGWHSSNITGGLGCTDSCEAMFLVLHWVAWIGNHLVTHFWLGLGQGVSLQCVGSEIIIPFDLENGSNSLLAWHLNRSGSPQWNGVFGHLLVGRVPSLHFSSTHVDLKKEQAFVQRVVNG